MKAWYTPLLLVALAACVPPSPTVQAPASLVAAAPQPTPAAPRPKRIAYDGGGYILPDGTRVEADPQGGFALPNGAYAAPDGLGGVRLPNGAVCRSDGAQGFLCP
jgi:hypothetical protein